LIYLYPSKNIVNDLYYSDCLTDPSVSIAENMRLFCQRILHLPKLTRGNGFIPLPELQYRKFLKRVVVHPTSAKEDKNWPKEKFVKLALHLKKEGYEPVFVPGTRERDEWTGLGFEVAVFPSLDLLARFIFESGYLVGNDSGLGHLASALKIPTLTFFRRKTAANMWAPSFHTGIALAPASWIPNISGLRWRDKYWKNLISVGMARRAFERLLTS
jgi:ADP-heptose:LPS heptosyltransferase